MKDRPFLEIFEFVLMLGVLVSNIWDFAFRPDHPPSSLVVSVLVIAAFALRCYRTVRSTAG